MKRVNIPDASHLRLDLEIAIWRYGWRLPVAVFALLACLFVWLFWLPVQVSRANRAAEQLQSAQQVGQASSFVVQEPPLRVFQRQLLPQKETSAQMRMIFQLAANAGVSVAQVDMRRQIDAAGAYSQLQIVLPVRGDYVNIKRFCADLLQGLQALSIDQVVLRREQPGPVDASISLSIWQEPAEGGK